MKKLTQMQNIYKINVLELAKDHKKYCDRSDCCVSLIMLMEMTEKMGITFTKTETEVFL